MNDNVEQKGSWRDPGPVIEEMARRIAEQFQPERIILFGSRAKGAGRRAGQRDFRTQRTSSWLPEGVVEERGDRTR
mgnify:CR=1 FL=1